MFLDISAQKGTAKTDSTISGLSREANGAESFAAKVARELTVIGGGVLDGAADGIKNVAEHPLSHAKDFGSALLLGYASRTSSWIRIPSALIAAAGMLSFAGQAYRSARDGRQAIADAWQDNADGAAQRTVIERSLGTLAFDAGGMLLAGAGGSRLGWHERLCNDQKAFSLLNVRSESLRRECLLPIERHKFAVASNPDHFRERTPIFRSFDDGERIVYRGGCGPLGQPPYESRYCPNRGNKVDVVSSKDAITSSIWSKQFGSESLTQRTNGDLVYSSNLGTRIEFANGSEARWSMRTGAVEYVSNSGKTVDFTDRTTIQLLAHYFKHQNHTRYGGKFLDILISEVGLVNHIPKGSVLIGSGAWAAVFKTPDNHALRVARWEPNGRINIPEVLQAISVDKVGAWQIEKLPLVKVSSSNASEIPALKESIQAKGYNFFDAHVFNVGRLPDGKVVVIDPGAVRKIGAPKLFAP